MIDFNEMVRYGRALGRFRVTSWANLYVLELAWRLKYGIEQGPIP